MMFKHQGVWLPDGEAHFPEWMTRNGEVVDGKGTYQIKKLRAALGYCKQFRAAVDVGAHVGFWSMQLTKRFEMLHAFEPVAAFRDCWVENMAPFMSGPENPEWDGHSMQLHQCALGARPGRVLMTVPKLNGGLDTGGTHVGGDGDIEMRTLDDFDFGHVDFIKIDCEGYEHHVIEGARDTIARWQPTIIVEQKPHKLGPNFGIKGTPAVDLLKAMGYTVRAEISGDYILTR
jgi:FkbM family methyltransferase